MKRALLIMGPTASGKSALALALAEKLAKSGQRGEIVNADSMQVYRDWRVLTARPSAEEEARAPHHLYGHIDAGERYSVGRWLMDAHRVIGEIRARSAMPIVVGGTGLYFKALTQGLIDAPAADEAARAKLKAEWDEHGGEALHARLAVLDSATAARLSPNDAPRVLRALEAAERGEILSSRANGSALQDWSGLLLKPERGELYKAIDRRFAAMLEAGALNEARDVMARGLDPQLPAMKAHGAPWLMAHLRGELGLEEAAALSQRDTRRYAKRQFTWMAGQMPDWTVLGGASLDERLKKTFHELSWNNFPEIDG